MKNRYKIASFIMFASAGLSCTKMICPAYQSSYLLNKEDQDKFFSYFEENEEEESGTAITDIHHDGEEPNLSTDIGYNSGNSPRGKDYPILPSSRNKNGISKGPTVKPKKSYKKKHYVVEMKDVYSSDSTSNENTSDSLQAAGNNYNDLDTTGLGGF